MSQIYLYGVISLSDICLEYGLYLLLSCQNVCQCKITIKSRCRVIFTRLGLLYHDSLLDVDN